jgi:hypothetical protein
VRPPKIATLPDVERRMFDHLIRGWLEETTPGKSALAACLSIEEAVDSVTSLIDEGLLLMQVEHPDSISVAITMVPAIDWKPIGR